MKQIFKSACVAARITSTAVIYSAKLVPTVLILEYGYVEESILYEYTLWMINHGTANGILAHVIIYCPTY